MRYFDANSLQRRRAVVAAFIVFWTVVVGAEWALPGIEPAPAHGPHTVHTSAAGTSTSVELDHSHASKADSNLTTDALAEAILPRGNISLIALGLAVPFAVLPLLWRWAVAAPIRGPPRNACVMGTGRAVLARFCIARR
ncbi:hypothetical protein PDG61_25810 [Mycolicibacterium sp. BiH015]|uniref:hypothetical protein n=1 Tax=Mycolicibacterium sp. BiH015 TaxID=3018808 RepID=UPI0022E92141|nr:hypothetical protein [Mycolicibacterium sp. BiH015]MDA2894350.1 hypothetical protein [Mycolicibacterium sp. BiH015]